MFDTHFHVDPDKPVDDVLARGTDAGVSRFLVAGTRVGSMAAMLDRVADRANVYAAVGVHPHDAALFDDDLDSYRQFATHRSVKAIGEIGLDYFYNTAPKEVQQRVFRQFLSLAADTNLPAVIHCRDAFGDCHDLVGAMLGSDDRFVIHCYTGTLEYAEKFLALGGYLSFNGIITFKKSVAVREIMKVTPIDRILFETDSPYLAPVPMRGKPNEPAYLPHIIRRAAEELDIGYEALIQQSTCNALTFYNIS